MNVILAIDSFKGCLTSLEAEKAASKAFTQDDEFICIPVSDGGEGFSKTLTDAFGGSFRTVKVSDPLGRPLEAQYGTIHNGRTAIIETAAASGLTLIDPSERNPLYTTSYGTGELIEDALNEGAEEIFLGLGGSATNDGGIGLLQALGYKFVTPGGYVIPGRAVLSNIIDVDDSGRNPRLKDCSIYGFYDVNVPFCGRGGATEIFSPQKGAGPEMVEALDDWMQQICCVYSRYCGKEIQTAPGSGAAGGIGGSIQAFLHARMFEGIEKFLDFVSMRLSLDMDFNVVITGEGKADNQTLTGKVPKGVLDYVRRYDMASKKPRTKVFLIAGKVENKDELLQAGFDGVLQVTPDNIPEKQALDKDYASSRIKETVELILNRL